MPLCALINGSRPRRVIIPMTFLQHLQSCWYACGSWRTRKVNAKQPLHFFFFFLFMAALAPPSFDEWMCVIPAGCNMYELCWHHFVAPAVMLSIVKQEHTTKSRQVWNTVCQLLSARPSLAVVCSGALPKPRDLRNSFFGKPTRCLVHTEICKGRPNYRQNLSYSFFLIYSLKSTSLCRLKKKITEYVWDLCW